MVSGMDVVAAGSVAHPSHWNFKNVFKPAYLYLYYWLIGKNSQLSVENKLLLYKTIIRPVWTYGIELWGSSKPSNTKILQAFQSKTLRLITAAPWFINNQTLHTDLCIAPIKDVIAATARKSRDRNSQHHNQLIAHLYSQPIANRRLQRRWPEDLIEWTPGIHHWMAPHSRHMPAPPYHLLNTLSGVDCNYATKLKKIKELLIYFVVAFYRV